MIRAHATAVTDLIDGVTVYLSRAPADPEMPYVVIHPDQGFAAAGNYLGQSTWRTWRFVSLAIGGTPEQAQWAAEKVEASVLDKRPAVPGRHCGLIRKESSVPVDRDEDGPTPVFLTRDVWVFNTVPA